MVACGLRAFLPDEFSVLVGAVGSCDVEELSWGFEFGPGVNSLVFYIHGVHVWVSSRMLLGLTNTPCMHVCCTALHCMAGPPVILEDLGGFMDVQQVDLTPITDLFADVTGAETGAVPGCGA